MIKTHKGDSSQSKFTLRKVAASVALTLAACSSAQAVNWNNGKWMVTFDSNFAYGASYRLDDADRDLIGKGNQLVYGFGENHQFTAEEQAFIGGYMVAAATGNSMALAALPGVYSTNGDDGNLNFADKGIFSNVFKTVHELDINFDDDFGFFARGTYFHDFEVTDGDRGHYVLNPGYLLDPVNQPIGVWKGLSRQAKKQHGEESRLLDAFLYGTFYVGDSPLQVRVGEQVINWGESTFIQHGVAEANPVDLAKLRVPGAELREAFIPVNSIWASYDVSDTVSLEAYYLLEWEPIRIDAAGTYFSTADFAGSGNNQIQLGFGLAPDTWSQAYRLEDKKASDDGQFGMRLAWLAENLNYTEFAFYYANYHNKRPIISANAYGLIDSLGIWASSGYFEYLEDISLYGMSFNTTLDSGWSIAGEVSYRQDEPLQIDDVELLFKTLEPLDELGPVARGTSQIPGSPVYGDFISGYRLFDTVQAQATFTNLLGPGMGADEQTLLIEVGMNQIMDMPNQSELRFEAPGTERSGNAVRASAEGVEEGEFATAFSWGYRAVYKLDYKDAFWGMNMSPRIVFQHDVDGKTPAPISNFHEDRKSLSLGVTFDYLSQWKADFKYNSYFGAGDENRLADRDFLSFTLSYSI
jgi:hypothetical protein